MKKYLIVGFLLTSLAAHAQTSRPTPQAGKSPVQESIAKLMDFVGKYGTLAGSANVCDATYYDNIRFCSLMIISHWPEVTRESVPLGKDFHDSVESVWMKSAQIGMSIQKKSPPPLSCGALVSNIKKEPIWDICGSLLNKPQPPVNAPPIDDGRIQ